MLASCSSIADLMHLVRSFLQGPTKSDLVDTWCCRFSSTFNKPFSKFRSI